MSPLHLKSCLLWRISMLSVAFWGLQGRSALHNACAAGLTEAGKNFSTEEIPVIFGRGMAMLIMMSMSLCDF